MGVLHLISGLFRGGAERMILDSAHLHDSGRFRLGVISLMAGGELSEPIRQAGVPVAEMGWGRGRATPRGLHSLLREVRAFSPRILQGHMFHANLLTRFLGPFLPGTVILNTLHSDPRGEPRMRRLAYAATAPLADAIIRFGFPPFPRGKARWIPYGIDLPPPPPLAPRAIRRAWGIPDQAFLWIAVGRLEPVKGFADLLEAFSLAVREAPGGRSVRLLIVGEGSEREALIARSRALGIEGQVALAGGRNDVPDLMAAADAFVLSSREEAGPLVVMEAQARGLPVAATRVGWVEAMVQEGRTGTLAPPGRPRELARAMETLMASPERARAWGGLAKERAEREYPFPRTQRALEEIYLGAAGGKGGGG